MSPCSSAGAEAAPALSLHRNLPPEDSPPLVRFLQLDFSAQGNVSSVDSETYLYYMEISNHVSAPSQDRWVPYTEEIEQILIEDFDRLWDTGSSTISRSR